MDWCSAEIELVTGVNGTVAFNGESRGDSDGLDPLKGTLHSSFARSSIKWCCCLQVSNKSPLKVNFDDF